jgi:hypothetical protein
VGLLCDLEPIAPEDEGYTTFWLVLADQLQRRGIPSEAQARAVAIIDDDSNLGMLEELGMSEPDLRRRRRNLEKLSDTLSGPLPRKQRKTLKNPQVLLMERGQVYVYPVDSRGHCVNPYFTDATRPAFEPARWGALQVVNAGHALGYLAWYELATARRPLRRKPSLKAAAAAVDPTRSGVGTLTRLHSSRMQLELLGSVDSPPLPQPPQDRTIRVTASDISIANLLSHWERPGTFR